MISAHARFVVSLAPKGRAYVSAETSGNTPVLICRCDTREEAETVCMDLELAAAGKGGCADGADGLRAAKLAGRAA